MPVRILIVDDHEVVRIGLRAMIATRGGEWQVCGEAGDGIAAVTQARQLTPDVVILDLEMPLMNGLEAAREIRRVSPLTKIILFSADESAEMHASHVDEVVSKFCDAGELPQAIQRLVNELTPTAPSRDGSTKPTKKRVPFFEIFRGHSGDRDAAWLESVQGLSAAEERMKEIASESPGAYFVFSISDRLALASVDTTPEDRGAESPNAKGVA